MRIIPGIANIKITTSFFIVNVNPEPINSSKQVIPTIAVHPPKMIPAEINPETNVFQNTLPFETFLKASIISKSLTFNDCLEKRYDATFIKGKNIPEMMYIK